MISYRGEDEMRIEFHDPEMDKNFSFHFFGTSQEIKKIRVIHAMLIITNDGREVRLNQIATLRGFDPEGGWAMIEMWTDDLDQFVALRDELEKLTGCVVEDFFP